MARGVGSIIAAARRDALRVVRSELGAALPDGWSVHLAVGWGLTVFDDQRKMIVGTYENAPARLPRGVRRALLTAARFCDTFGYGNETITPKKGRA